MQTYKTHMRFVRMHAAPAGRGKMPCTCVIALLGIASFAGLVLLAAAMYLLQNRQS